MKRKSLLSLLVMTFLTVVGYAPSVHSEAVVPVNLPKTFSADIESGMTHIDMPFEISGTTGFSLQAIVPVEGAVFNLKSPSGSVVFQLGDSRVQFTSGTEVEPVQPPPGGVFTTDEILSPQAGQWTITLDFPSAPENTVCMATLFLRSDFQMGIAIERESYLKGEDAPIGLLVLDKGLPVLGATVKISISQIGSAEEGEAQTALDDGQNADGLANDGLYSIDYTFAAPGTYLISGKVDIQTQSGIVSREVAKTVEVLESTYAIGNVSMQNVVGPNGCISAVRTTINGSVAIEGEFLFSAVLAASNGNTIETRSLQTLTAGPSTITLDFEGEDIKSNLALDGPYALSSLQVLRLVEGTPALAYRDESLGNTTDIALANLCTSPIVLESSLNTVYSVKNGFIDGLTFAFPITVNTAGYYQVSFKIIGNQGEDIDLKAVSTYLSPGRNEVNFNLPAAKFLSADGPYSVISLLVIGGGNSANLAEVGKTDAYKRWQFYPRFKGDLDNDGDVDAADRNILGVEKGKQRLNPGDRRDINGDGIIDLRDMRDIVKLSCAMGACPSF